jgi:hypothetical protein
VLHWQYLGSRNYGLQQNYFHQVPVILHHQVPVILHDNLQRGSQTLRPSYLKSHDCSCHVSRRILASPPRFMRRRFRSFPACDITLGSLTLPAPEAGDFVELLLPYALQHPVGNIITLASSTVWTLSTAPCSEQKLEHVSRTGLVPMLSRKINSEAHSAGPDTQSYFKILSFSYRTQLKRPFH